ncbi:hypothetical protein D9M70_390380 [compost metagenome]
MGGQRTAGEQPGLGQHEGAGTYRTEGDAGSVPQAEPVGAGLQGVGRGQGADAGQGNHRGGLAFGIRVTVPGAADFAIRVSTPVPHPQGGQVGIGMSGGQAIGDREQIGQAMGGCQLGAGIEQEVDLQHGFHCQFFLRICRLRRSSSGAGRCTLGPTSPLPQPEV